MKRLLIYIIGFVLTTAVASAQDYETAYRALQQQFEERSANTPALIKTYLDQ